MLKNLAMLLVLGLSSTSFAVELTGEHLYQEMNASEKHELENSLAESSLELDDYLNTKILIDEETKNISIDLDSITPSSEYKRWVFSGGLTYLFPIGGGVIGEVALQNKNGNKIFKSQFSVTTTGTFSKGAVQSYQWNPQVQFGRAKIHAGPVVQVLHINNPMLEGQQNFFYRAMGANLGYEFTKKIHDHRWTVDVFAQGTIGGLNYNPTNYYLLGGGISITYSGKIKKKY